MKDLNILDLQRERNRLREKVRNNPTNVNRDLLRLTRNKLKHEITSTKQNFFKKLLRNKSSKTVWKTINKILHPNPKNANVDPEEVNKFFNDTATRTTGKMISSREDIDKLISNLAVNPDTFQLQPVTFNEVTKAIKSLRQDCSTGYDQIPAKFVKCGADFIASPLTHIINKCIEMSTFPDEWKVSRICPIPKTLSPSTLVDYRPISVLPVLSKVFERVILKQLTDFIELKAIYHDKQSGFRKGHSTTTLLLKLKDDILNAMRKGEVTLSIFADFSKAFDTVDYPILINQLHHLGFSTHFIRLIDSYLTNRYQYVQVNDKSSNRLRVNFGVPQGSILGPVLFNLYVCLLNQNGPSSYLQYADDVTLKQHAKVKDIGQTVTSMQNEMTNIFNWSTQNNLQLNPTKTKLMLFSTKQLSRLHHLDDLDINITSDQQPIRRVKVFKILGVHFNENLQWNDHINSIIKSGYATLRSLKQFKRFADFKLKKTLAECLVLSKIKYCDAIFCDTPKYLVTRLQKLQNASASFIYNKHCNMNDVLKLRWLPVEEGMSFSIVKLAHKSLHDSDTWPSYLKLSFKPQPLRALRENELLRTNVVVTNNVEGTFCYAAAINFNDLPVNVRKTVDYNKFSSETRKYLFDKATARVLELNV